MKVLLLGGTGFVGTNVAECLKENAIDHAVVSRKTGHDLREMTVCADLFSREKPDFIINCAAHVGSLNYVTQQAAEVIVDNARMIVAMYTSAAQACPKATIINPIANCAFPGVAETYLEDEWQNGQLHRSVLSYGATRRFLWAAGESFSMQYGIRTINLFVPNMYGPHDSTDPNKAHALNALVAKFVKAERTNQPKMEIWGTGIAIREWLYARDFGRILVQIIKDPLMIGLDEPVNIAQNFGLSVRELVQIIQSHFKYTGEIVFDPTKPDGAPKKVMDDRKFRKVFPDFKFTPFENGILNTIKYYNSIYPY